MNVEQWLGKDNKLGVDIFNRKYRKGNETFEQWLDRVSGGDDAVRAAIKSKRFLFGGRILSNRGVTDTKTWEDRMADAKAHLEKLRNKLEVASN